jgi:hypothetical protein
LQAVTTRIHGFCGCICVGGGMATNIEAVGTEIERNLLDGSYCDCSAY